MPHFNEKRFKEVCKEITETCDCKDGYCFYRLLVTKQHPSLRLLIQMECMEKFKWILSEKEGKDVGHDLASHKWVEGGWADKFAQFYNENESACSIFEKVMQALPLQ